jgi:hypothetical protein
MQFIEFRDTCLIQRETGVKDEWDNAVKETIYNGECLYEEGGAGYSRSIITRSPTVFLPGVTVQVRINDSVTVTTEFGREIKSVARIVRDINMPWRTNVKVTKIELKQAQGD